MRYGLSYLGGAKYPDVILREHPADWAAAFFTQKNLFGDAKGIVTRLLQTGRCPAIKLNLAWKDNHSFSQRDFPAIVKEAKRFAPLVNEFPNVEFLFNGATEHTLRQADAVALKDAVLAALPARSQYINNPWEGKGAIIPSSGRVLNEVHGNHAKPQSGRYTFDFDGSSAVDADVMAIKARHANAEIFFFWVPQFNLRKNTNDTTPRPQRKAVPTAKLIDSVIYLHRDKGATSLSNKHIWKSHADQHNVPIPEPRALKPVFITPVNASRIQAVASNGQVVAVSSPKQPFNDGRFRYYFSDMYGFEYSEKARRIQGGDPVVSLVANGKVIGKVNMAFRDGSYR